MSAEKINALKELFANFPRSQDSAENLAIRLRSMLEHLEEHEDRDVIHAVKAFIGGKVPGQSYGFAPSTSALCEEVRSAKRIREIMTRPRQSEPKYRPHLSIIQKQEALRIKWGAGREPLAEGLTYMDYHKTRSRWPNGHIFVCALGVVYGPKAPEPFQAKGRAA